MWFAIFTFTSLFSSVFFFNSFFYSYLFKGLLLLIFLSVESAELNLNVNYIPCNQINLMSQVYLFKLH